MYWSRIAAYPRLGIQPPWEETIPQEKLALKLIKAGRLIDSRDGASIERGALLIEGSKIVQVGPERQVSVPEGAEVAVHAFPDKTVLPGLVDCHVHLTMPGDGTAVEEAMDLPDELLVLRAAYNARKALEAGTTTLREMGAKNRTTFMLREGMRRGLAVGPRLILSGRPITVTGGHCWMMGSQADGVDGVRREVRQLIKEGADFIKIMATGGATRGTVPHQASYTPDELRAAVDEAHRLGKGAAVHCLSLQGIANAVDAGADMLIHCMFRDERGMPAYDEGLADRIARAEVPVNPTVHVLRHRLWRLRQKAQEQSLDDEEARLLLYEEQTMEIRLDMVRRLHKAGVKLLPGSDTAWYWYPVGQFVAELDALVEAALTPRDALLSATRDTAQAIGMLDTIGTLETGKTADILVVDGDPTVDINALWNVVAVFSGGQQVR